MSYSTVDYIDKTADQLRAEFERDPWINQPSYPLHVQSGGRDRRPGVE